MTPRSSFAELLADPGSSAPAIVSISPLVVVSYKALAGQIERLSGQLRGAGLKPGDSVAIVLPNSLEFLVVFLALTHARLVATPLNPADKPDEIRFFVADAQARAVVAEGANIAVKEAAAGLSLPVLQPRVDSRGVVELPELPQGSRTSLDTAHPDDVALFAYTVRKQKLAAGRSRTYTQNIATLILRLPPRLMLDISDRRAQETQPGPQGRTCP
jgi:acyl-CoA synthetase (AMP-forming)/AMP-acid ligase II